MNKDNAPRKRLPKSTRLSNKTAIAYEDGKLLLAQLERDDYLGTVLSSPDGQRAVEQLRQDLAVLAVAPMLRIGAARRLQGVALRRKTAAQNLFDATADIRRRIKNRYRGPKHSLVRRDFGEGITASPTKPESVQTLAEQVISAAERNPQILKQVHIGLPTIARVKNLLRSLRASSPERTQLRDARREMVDSLNQTANRVQESCAEIRTLLRQLQMNTADRQEPERV